MNLFCRIKTSAYMRLGRLLGDKKLFLKGLFQRSTGNKLHLNNPQTFGEKIQWLKLYDHNESYHNLVDKYIVKEYVKKAIGEEFVIKTIAVWDNLDDINLDSLPERFVLKTTNGGGSSGVIICKDKTTFNLQEAKNRLRWSLNYDVYQQLGEWAYKGIKPRIIAEQYIEPDSKTGDLPDYKWFCFNGDPKFCQVILDRHQKETIDFFDVNWHHQVFTGLNPDVSNASMMPMKPLNMKTQLDIAKKLSSGFPFCRIDLYEANGRTYFGEITFYPMSGMGRFRPEQYNYIIGNMLNLPVLKKKTESQ